MPTQVSAGLVSQDPDAIDYIEAGHPLSEFLEDFPTLSKEQAVAALSRPGKHCSLVRVLREECCPGG